VDTLRRSVGTAAAEHLSALSQGIDPRPVQPDEVEKSISADRTLDTDLTEEADVRRELLRLAEEVGSRVRARGFAARTIGIKIRFADFRTVTRARTLLTWTAATSDIFDTALELYRSLHLDRPRIRLVGVKCEGLREADAVPEQLTLDLAPVGSEPAGPRPAAPRSRADVAIDAARARFGAQAVQPGSLVAGPGRRPESRLPVDPS
jgi:DNA polymerase-4